MKRVLTIFSLLCFVNGYSQLGVNHKEAIKISECGLGYVETSITLTKRVIVNTRASAFLGENLPTAIQISGIPECAPIIKAYAWYDIVGGNNNQGITVTNPTGATTNVSPTLVGNHPKSKIWEATGYNRTYSFRADITSAISGNGTYSITGLPQAGPNGKGVADTDGITIFVIFSDPSKTYEGHMVIWDGGDIQIGQPYQPETGKATQTITGINACGTSTFAEAFALISDMQYNYIQPKLGMNNAPLKSFESKFWNFEKEITQVAKNQNSAKFQVYSGGYLRSDNKEIFPADAYNFMMMGLYYRTTDCKTCTPTANPDPVVATANSTQPTCGSAKGSINITSSGGVGNYTYSWQPPVSTGQSASDLDPGTYTIIVKSGCDETEVSVTLEQIGNLSGNVSIVYEDGCDRFGGSLGNATVVPQGGTSPFTYHWDDELEQTTATAVGLKAGSYNVVVTDNNGCEFSETVEIENKIQVGFNVITEPCGSCSNGEIQGVVNGFGTPPFTYRWNDANEQTTIGATGLVSGTYVLVVTDANGCYSSDTIHIGITDLGNQISDLSNQISVYPNPSSGSFTVGTPVNEIVELRVYDPRGKVIISKQYTAGRAERIQLNVSNGIYFVQVLTPNEIITKQILITNN